MTAPILWEKNSPLLDITIVFLLFISSYFFCLFLCFKLDNVQVISENDFSSLIAKRRIEKALNDIVYIQSYMKPRVKL
jgi:hypothetical protein